MRGHWVDLLIITGDKLLSSEHEDILVVIKAGRRFESLGFHLLQLDVLLEYSSLQ